MKIEQILKLAQQEIGVKEDPPNSNNVKYNTWLYGHPVEGSAYPWCAAFVSWLFKDTGLVKKSASCMDMASWFKACNRWTRNPEPGDVVFFKFNSNNRWTNHTGIVIQVNGSQIVTIEGNTSSDSKGSQDNGGIVAKRKRTAAYIVGYGRPAYSDAMPIVDHSTLKTGSTGPQVKELQGLLNQNGARLAVDGSFGPATKQAVMEYQREHNLEIDGIVGVLTWASLLKL